MSNLMIAINLREAGLRETSRTDKETIMLHYHLSKGYSPMEDHESLIR